LVRSGDRLDPVEGFEFMKAHRAAHSIATMCRRKLDVAQRAED
jgi:hypothetical protein